VRSATRTSTASAHDQCHRKFIRDSPPGTVRSKGYLSNKTALAMIFKLAEAEERSCPSSHGHN
jgi:hypothetical protein